MYQLMLNLVSNGLKFRGEQPPLIRVEALPVTEELMRTLALPGSDYTLIRVSDNGIGFDPKYADTIFGIFQRLHGQGRYEGTGIGLSIVKKIVENHRGAVLAEGLPGQGATFTLVLPTARLETSP